MYSYNKSAANEIKRLINENGGVLTPDQLVDYASSEKSPLHKYFTWDNTEAAKKCRIYEARTLLRVCVEIIPNGKANIVHRVTTHLSSDGTGYRAVADVLTDEELTAQMLSDALNELESFKKKYSRLKELSVVFKAIDKVKLPKRKKMKKAA